MEPRSFRLSFDDHAVVAQAIAEISYVVCCVAGAIVSIIVKRHKGRTKAYRSRLKRVNRIHNHECTTC